MKKIISLACMLALLILVIMPCLAVAQTGTNIEGIDPLDFAYLKLGNYNATFLVGSTIWQAYETVGTGTNCHDVYLECSEDNGLTWGNKTLLVDEIYKNNFAICHDGNYGHIAYAKTGEHHVMYMRFSIEGTVVTPGDEVKTDLITYNDAITGIAVDTDNHVYIAYYNDSTYFNSIARNELTGPTWTTQEGYPKAISEYGVAYIRSCNEALNPGILIIYKGAQNILYAKYLRNDILQEYIYCGTLGSRGEYFQLAVNGDTGTAWVAFLNYESKMSFVILENGKKVKTEVSQWNHPYQTAVAIQTLETTDSAIIYFTDQGNNLLKRVKIDSSGFHNVEIIRTDLTRPWLSLWELSTYGESGCAYIGGSYLKWSSNAVQGVPMCDTLEAENETSSGAKLRGKVIFDGEWSEYCSGKFKVVNTETSDFDWYIDENEELETDEIVEMTVSDLESGKEYKYQFYVENENGIGEGGWETFSTYETGETGPAPTGDYGSWDSIIGGMSEFLDSLNLTVKIIGALVVMILFCILASVKFKASTLIIAVIISACTIAFTVLGWFPSWIIILAAVAVGLGIFIKVTRG